MSTYRSLDDYNADVKAARDAYAADQRVAAGFCETGDGRKRDEHRRKCWTCRHEAAS
jgi:hypothetical protein